MAGFSLKDCPAYDEWQIFLSEALRRKLANALERLSWHYGGAGTYETAIDYARRWLALDPLQEAAHRQLMALLDQSGQRAAALRQYQICQEVLADELGVEPSEETQNLYQQIQSNTLAVARDSRPRSNLPAQATPFIGREAELAELEALIEDSEVRLVTIVGPGGMGKTRLALAAAEGHLGSALFSDGIFFVDLAALNDPGLVVSATIEALGLRLQGADDAVVKAQLLDFLDQKRMLLLFDNCEHVLAGMDLAADILQSAPGVQVLATSRERLHLRLEQVYPIEGLDFPDWETPEDAVGYAAVRLFLQSATRNRPDFNLEGQADLNYLARICRLVAGMPLALELAASWVDVLPLSKIAAGLQGGLDLLETELRDMPDRHRSVRAAIDHSWGLLAEKERLAFARLSVFRGGFTRAAVRDVAGAGLGQLGRLVNKSFLKYDPGSDRYQVHELMRQYGAEKLSDVESLRTQHLNYFVGFAEQVEAGLEGPEPEKWVGPRNAEIDNVRTALDWAVESGRAQTGLKLGVAYGGYWGSHDFREGRQRLEQLLELPQAAEATQGKADAFNLAGWLAHQLGDFESGLGLSEESISIGREMGDMGKLSLGWALINKGFQLRYRDVATALHALEEGIAILQQLDESPQLCWGLTVRGYLAYLQGNTTQAYAFTNESLALARKNNYKLESCSSMLFLGMLLYNQGDYDSARTNLEEALLIEDSAGDNTWAVHQGLGAIALLQGDHLQSVAYFERALAEHRQRGSKMHIARSMSDLGIASGHLGDHSRAADLIHATLLLNQEVSSEHEIGICLLGAAGVQKSPRNGALLLGACWATLVAAGEVIQPIYQAEKERIEKAARADLGEDAYAAAYAEGQAMPMDQAIAMALADSDEWVDGSLTSFNWGLEESDSTSGTE
jgi:predicted ATPase